MSEELGQLGPFPVAVSKYLTLEGECRPPRKHDTRENRAAYEPWLKPVYAAKNEASLTSPLRLDDLHELYVIQYGRLFLCHRHRKMHRYTFGPGTSPFLIFRATFSHAIRNTLDVL